MDLIVGLGNPGRRYRNTRHNIGFCVLDELARRRAIQFRESWTCPARIGIERYREGKLILAKPNTLMNRSGVAVTALLRKRGVAVQRSLIVYDDVGLDLGRIRIRTSGSAGGHNGLKSSLAAFGTEEVARVRVGIGPKPSGVDMVSYVLGEFERDEMERIDLELGRACDAVEHILSEGVVSAMNEFN